MLTRWGPLGKTLQGAVGGTQKMFKVMETWNIFQEGFSGEIRYLIREQKYCEYNKAYIKTEIPLTEVLTRYSFSGRYTLSHIF